MLVRIYLAGTDLVAVTGDFNIKSERKAMTMKAIIQPFKLDAVKESARRFTTSTEMG
jgi:hypothetical protein